MGEAETQIRSGNQSQLIFTDYRGAPFKDQIYNYDGLRIPASKPHRVPEDVLRKYGAKPWKTWRYSAPKEKIYLSEFKPDPHFLQTVIKLFSNVGGFDPEQHLLFVVRPAATMSAYHNFENPLFLALLQRLKKRSDVRVILLPRTPDQRDELEAETGDTIVIPDKPLDGCNLVWHADAVISAGGTMCREAAVFGTPAFTIFWGKMGSVDKKLISEGKLTQIESEEDFKSLPCTRINARNEVEPLFREHIVYLCLSAIRHTIK